MPNIVMRIDGIDAESRVQLEYALTFASEDILSYRINGEAQLEVEVTTDTALESVRRKVEDLVQRYEKTEFGLPTSIEFRNERNLPVIDAWTEMLARRWVTPVGQGHMVLRGTAAELMRLIEARIDRVFVPVFNAEREVYPSTIECRTLDRCKHFTSFPEHVDFVAHLKQDVDVLRDFAEGCRTNGWSPAEHDGRMAANDFAISPSCCYHCYEGMEGWQLASPGRSVTATLNCHRHEGANHRTLTRLRAFTMREIIWVGQPRFVVEARTKAEALLVQWAKDWELVGTFETANDMFFTQDFAVKASFQRQQQAKKELRLLIPAEDRAISVFSSNFHAMTFGKAFNITVDGRTATSGCIGWGYERWVYAIFSQFGLDPSGWPRQLREEFEESKSAYDRRDQR